MDYKVGDKLNVKDGSWSFGISSNGRYDRHIPVLQRDNLTVITTGLSTMRCSNGDTDGYFSEVCDLLVTNGDGGYWFVKSEFCEPADKEIEVRYFCDGVDITSEISEETKRNLK